MSNTLYDQDYYDQVAANETDLDADALPAICRWLFEQIMDPDFWPDRPLS